MRPFLTIEKIAYIKNKSDDPLLDSVNTTYADKGRTNDVFCFRTRWIALVFLLNIYLWTENVSEHTIPVFIQHLKCFSV